MRTLAAARILTGVLMVASGWGKATGDFVKSGFAASAREMASGTWPFWKTFLERTVLRHAEIFGWIVALGEIAVGAGLILGFLTRSAAAGGVVLMLVILLGSGRAEPGSSWNQWVTSGLTAKFALLLMAVFFALDAGRIWGIDARLRRKAGPRPS